MQSHHVADRFCLEDGWEYGREPEDSTCSIAIILLGLVASSADWGVEWRVM